MTIRFTPRTWLMGAANWLWQWLRRPWLAIFAGVIGLLLTLAVWLLPQLPGQLVDEKAAAATWLLDASSAYGIWGNFLLALGLFDVLRSPLLYLLLALLVPTLAAQLADQLGALRQQRSAQHAIASAVHEETGAALPISSARALFRWRGMVNADPTTVANILEAKLQDSFTRTNRRDVPLANPAVSNTREGAARESTAEETITGEEQAEDGRARDRREPISAVETRILATHFPRLHFLRPLLMVGLLIAVSGAWIALAFGWQVSAPPLAPGDTFRSANRNLVVNYTLPQTATQSAQLMISLQGEQVLVPADQPTQQRVGYANIQVRPAYLGVWMTTADGGSRLALPGETKLRSTIGLVFAEPGSEESILIPDQGAGLRIIQRAGSDTFVLELYRSDTIQPVYRAELTPGGQMTIPFAPGDTELVISTLPGLQVDVRHLPGLWLVPLGILFAFIGAVAFMRQSIFVVAQVAPWMPDLPLGSALEHTPDYSVVILQSDVPQVVDDLAALVAALPPADATLDGAQEETVLPALTQPAA